MALSTNIYAEVTTTFPASVEAGSGIIISKSGGVYTVSFDPSGISMNSITNAQMATLAGQRLIGNPAGIVTDRSEISLGSDLEFSGTTVQGAALTGAVVKDAGGTVTSLGANVVGTAHLADGAVTTVKLAADAVDGTKIPDDAIGNEHIAADAIHVAQIATDAVTADAIAANAVGASELADNAVDTAAIADDAVTFAKIADMGNATVLSNVSGGSASPSANTGSAFLDGVFGSTHGSILYRAASTWLQLGPGTSGQFLKTMGASQNPAWDSVSASISQKVGSFTRNSAAATGTQAITGVGFQPSTVIFLAQENSATGQFSMGFDNGTASHVVFDHYTVAANTWANSSGHCIWTRESISSYAQGTLNSMDSDGFTVGWTKTGSPSGTINVFYLAIG